MTDADLQTKLAEYEGIIQMLTAKVEELAACNERLTSELTAHQTLKAIYADPNQPATVRVRAAQAALHVEPPPLAPERAPLDLAVVEERESLAQLVERRRARQNALEPPYRVLPDGHTVVLLKGNGSDDDDSKD